MPEQRVPERRGRGGTRRRPRNSLNPEVIVRAAAALIDRRGPGAVYRHFRSKDELLLATLRKSGLPDADVARYTRVLDDFILAQAGQTAAFFALDEASRGADVRAWYEEYPRPPKDTYPAVASLVHLLPGIDDPANFETALDLMLTAIAARAAAHAAEGQGC